MPTEEADMPSTPPPSCLCRRCGGRVDPAARRCSHCNGPGPRVVWPDRSLRVMWVAVGTVLGAIGLAFALPYVASWIFGDAEGWSYVGILIGLPAFLLLVPVLILAAVVDYAGRRAYPGKPIVASWDVRVDGEDHVVSLPASSVSSPTTYAWVDGARIPLKWTPTSFTTTRAALDGGTFSGTLSMGYEAREMALLPLVIVATAAVGSVGYPTSRYVLKVEGAIVGKRRS